MNATINRILVATDRSQASARAVEWAALMAERYGADLVVLQVLPPARPGSSEPEAPDSAQHDLALLVERLAGMRGRARLVVDSDPSRAIVRTAAEEAVDVVVVGNSGMRGRKEFRAGSVPNRVSHNARCTVIVVNTTDLGPDGRASTDSRTDDTAGPDDASSRPVEGELLRRAIRIARTMAGHGLPGILSVMTDDESSKKQARHLRAALDELGPTFVS